MATQTRDMRRICLLFSPGNSSANSKQEPAEENRKCYAQYMENSTKAKHSIIVYA
jgi:hypothetical protein